LITLLSGALFLHELLPKDSTLSILSAIGLMAFALFIQRYISRAEVQIKLSDDTLAIRWLKQFIFHKRSDMEISLTDIESYKYQEDTNFDLFKLTLKDGTELKFWHFTFTRGDDFEKLIFDFPSKVSRHNKKIERKSDKTDTSKMPEKAETIIKKEKTIFENAYAPFLAGFAILLLITVPLVLFMKPTGKSSNPFIGLAGMFGGLLFLIQYFKYRKKNKTEQL
jgi:hypothetical protein